MYYHILKYIFGVFCIINILIVRQLNFFVPSLNKKSLNNATEHNISYTFIDKTNVMYHSILIPLSYVQNIRVYPR